MIEQQSHNRSRATALLCCATLIATLFRAAPLMGDSEPYQASRDYRLALIRTALETQGTKMTPAALAGLTQSVMAASEKNSLDPLLVLAMIQVESQFNHRAISPQGAQGLMQIQPVAVEALLDEGKIQHPAGGRHINLIDPAVNVQVGASYLALMKEIFGDLRIALTAYNLGPTWVSKKIAARETLPSEYAAKIFSAQRSLKNQLALKSKSADEAARQLEADS